MKESGKRHGEACASRRLGREGPYWHALVFAVLASASPWAPQPPPRRVTQRRRSLIVRVVDTFESIAGRLSNQNVKRISKGPWGPSKAAAVSPRCSCIHVSLENSGSGVDSPNQQKAGLKDAV